jgi:hypothetical protein
MRTALLATYPDLTNDLSLAWCLVDAYIDGRRRGRSVAGSVVVFPDVERREAFSAYAKRLGIAVEELLGDEKQPWKLVVSDQFPKELLPK